MNNERHAKFGREMIRVIRQALTCMAVLSLAAICPGQSASDAQRVRWLREHAVAVRSIDPADEDFDDLKRLGEAIGDARVVLIGEASHGDGAALLAKGRLIRFLHQRKGFDVLAWESSFYECAKAGQAVANGAKWQNAFDKALLWSQVAQVGPTMRYAAATQRGKRPIAQTGMAWYNTAQSPLWADVTAFFEAVDPALPTRGQRDALAWSRKFLEQLGTHRLPAKPVQPPEMKHLDAMIEMLARDADKRFSRKHGERQVGFMRLALENLKGHVLYFHRPPSRGGADDNPIGTQEGRNLLFIAREYFPNRKLIVWAHNGHLMRGSSQIEEIANKFKTEQTVAAGQHLHDALGDDVYSIMITAYGGQWRDWRNETRDLPAPPQRSLEDLLHRAGLKFGFVDLRGLPANHWLRGRLLARPIAHHPMRADWGQVFDGVFFIDAMTPTSAVESKP